MLRVRCYKLAINLQSGCKFAIILGIILFFSLLCAVVLSMFTTAPMFTQLLLQISLPMAIWASSGESRARCMALRSSSSLMASSSGYSS